MMPASFPDGDAWIEPMQKIIGRGETFPPHASEPPLIGHPCPDTRPKQDQSLGMPPPGAKRKHHDDMDDMDVEGGGEMHGNEDDGEQLVDVDGGLGMGDLPSWEDGAALNLVAQIPVVASPEKVRPAEQARPVPPPQAPSSNPPPPKASLSAPQAIKNVMEGEEVYIYGTGADFKKKTTAVLRVDESGTVTAEIEDGRSLNLYELAVVARNRFRRPRTSIKMSKTGEELGAFEARHGIYSRDDAAMAAAASASNAKNDEDGRNDSADYEKQRNMQRMYTKERRKREKEAERKKNPEDVTVPPASRWLPTGTWSKFSRQQGTTAATKGWKKAAGGGPAPACGGSRSSGGEARPDEDKLARIIDKSHRVWRQNVPLLYEQMMIQPLDQSSLTVQWMPEVSPVLVEVVNPDRTAIPPGLLMQHKMLFGTFSREDAEGGRRRRDYVMIGAVLLPKDIGEESDRDVILRRDMRAASNNAQMNVLVKVPHDGEVNRARYMPQRPNWVATKSGNPEGQVYLFDMSKHGANPKNDDGGGKHELLLRGHSKEGYGICWSEKKQGMLLSGSYDDRICMWDINMEPSETEELGRYLDPVSTRSGHTDAVGDVAWHPHHRDTFGSVGDDKLLCLWDARKQGGPAQQVVASDFGVNSLSYNHINSHLIATASGSSEGGTVSVWDSRKLSTPQRVFSTHTDVVDQVVWAPHSEELLMSASRDRLVHIIDTSKAARKDKPEDPPEIVFVHAGHTAKVSDISWHLHNPWLFASVSDGEQTLHVWHPNAEFIEEDEEEVMSSASSYDSDELDALLMEQQAAKQ